MRRSTLAPLAVAMLAACSQPNATPAPGTPQIPPAREAVTAACVGGITGGGEGVTIRADDHLISWSRASASGVRTERDLGPDTVLANEVLRQLDAIHFGAREGHDSGDMTCSLSVGSHEVSWSQGDPRAPADLVAVHDLVFTADGAR
jgi:hypothetical protein